MFIILGTSKSVSSENYYTHERIKMWGMLNIAGITKNYWENLDDFNTNGTNAFAEKHGFQFLDLVNIIYSNDKEINFEKCAQQISRKVHEIESDAEISSILFNGKTACTLYKSALYASASNSEFHFNKKYRKDLNFGKIDLPGNKKYYCLPNTSSRVKSFDEFEWLKVLRILSKK